MSNAVIRAEFETRLKQWADAQTPKILIAFQGVGFQKPTDGSPFLEPYLMPNTTTNKELSGARQTYLGLFQVNCWAQSGKGMNQVESLAQSVIGLFPILPKSGAVSVDCTPTAERVIPDPSGWLIVPVTIKYRMETF